MLGAQHEPRNLEDLVVVVTGATRGLGMSLVSAFRRAGCRVVSLSRSSDPRILADDAQGESSLLMYQVDVADPDSVNRAVSDVTARFGGVDVLINNAAVYPKVSFLEESARDFNQALMINVAGVSNCCKAVLPGMIDRGYGRIYNVGSWAHGGPIVKSAVYSASKGAVHSLTKAIAQDLIELDMNVEVHEWIPGHLNTRMSEFTGIDPAISANWAVEMVRRDRASKKNSIFQNDREWQPPKRLKERVLGKIFFWR